MKGLLYTILASIVILIVGSCDREGAQLDKTFDRVDAIMADHPDSALKIMESIDTTGLSQARLARYALLLTEALRKNALNPTNDTIISIALNYYCGQENTDEMRSIFLYSLVMLNKGSYKVALPYATIAYDMAMEQEDWFYAGMSARVLTDLYKFLYTYPEQKKYAIFAKEAFLKYEKEKGIDNRYSAWMDGTIADAMMDIGEYQQSLTLCNQISEEAMKKNPTLRHSVKLTKADAYNRLNMPQTSISIMDSLMNDGYEMESYNWNHLASFYYNVGDLANSRIALDSAKKHIKYDQDTLYIAYLEYILSDTKNHHQSLIALQNYNNEVAKTTNRIIANSALPNVTESYMQKANEYKLNIRKEKRRFWTSVTIAIVVLSSIAIYFTKYISSKRKEITSLNEKEADLDETIELLMGELSSLSNIINEEKVKNSTSEANLRNIFKSHLKGINKLCTLLYTASETEGNENRIIKNIRKFIISEQSLKNIDEVIDFISDGFIDTVVLNFPKMYLSRLRLVRYLYFGFSFETMMILFNYKPEKRNNLDSAKSNLKKQILNKKDWIDTTATAVLSKLNYK